MKKNTFYLGTGLVLVSLLQACNQETVVEESAAEAVSSNAELTTLEQRFSYSLGAGLANNVKQQGVDVDADIFTQAFKEVLSGGESRMGDDEMMAVQQEMMMQIQEKAQQEQLAATEENKAAGEQFLADNATKEGVMQTDSGLQYKVLTEGEGNKPAATDEVTVHYRGTLTDGSEFDSSYSRGQPATFPLNGVISGWTEGLQLMAEGSKYEFYIPYQLAYGEAGRPPSIPPSSVLVFEVELLSIVERDAAE